MYKRQGNDFSYIANEYKITFTQPHDYTKDSLKNGLFLPDYSGEFLSVLMEINNSEINQSYGGIGGFKKLIEINDNSDYDYDEIMDVYRTKIGSIVDYLNGLSSRSGGTDTEEYNKMLQDIVGEYKLLISNQLDSIMSLVDASVLSKDMEVAINKDKMIIENNTLQYNMYNDEYLINSYAQEAYDHTFTENLIVVTHDDANGLYQARPKTAFDTVVSNKHTAKQNSVDRQTKINELTNDMLMLTSDTFDPLEYSRLSEKCEGLIEEFKAKYDEISQRAVEVVDNYLNYTNKEFLNARIEKREMIHPGMFINILISFVIGAIIMFIIYAFFEFMGDIGKQNAVRRKVKRFNRQNY